MRMRTVVVFCIIIPALLACVDKDKKQGQAPQVKNQGADAKQPKNQEPAGDKDKNDANIPLPPKQAEFVKAVESFFSSYKSASNELKKSALRSERRQSISNTLEGYEINGWVGTLVRMGTNSEGKAHVEIKLAGSNKIAVKTWNNALSDITDSTLIGNGTPLYNAISELSNGDKIVFSGVFIVDEKDYIRESSITERGSMLDPAFVIRLTEVTKVK